MTTTMEAPDSSTTLSSTCTDVDSQGFEEDIPSGALTPAMSNVSTNRSTATFISTTSTSTSTGTEEEEEEVSVAESWEPIPPSSEGEEESSEEPQPLRESMTLRLERAQVQMDAAAVGQAYKERSLAVQASLVKDKKQHQQQKTPAAGLLLFFLVALLLAFLAASGRLDTYLEEAVEARVRTKSSFVVSPMLHVSPAPSMAPVPAPTLLSPQPIPSPATAPAPTSTPKEFKNDSSNFVWLSLDDDVLAGSVFWENDTTSTSSTPKEQHKANASFFSFTQHKRLFGYKKETTNKKRGMKKGPLHWIARHYQRLNIFVLGQSQLAQIKRKTNMMQWGPQ